MIVVPSGERLVNYQFVCCNSMCRNFGTCRGKSIDSSICCCVLLQHCLLQLTVTQYIKHFLGRGRLQNILRGKRLCLGIRRCPNALSSFSQIVGSMLKLKFGVKQQPIGSRFTKGHAHAARVDNTGIADHAVKLDMGVATDDQGYLQFRKNGKETFCGGTLGKDFGVVAGRGVAWQNNTLPIPSISMPMDCGQLANTCSSSADSC